MGALESPALFKRYQISIGDYYRMSELGLLPEKRIELIEGEIVEMPAIGSRHGSAVMRLNRLLVNAAGERAHVLVQSTLDLSEHSAPEPDLALLRPRADVYADANPGPQDVLLLIEVADSSARYDREVKLPLYARYGIPEVWIVDLDAHVIRLNRKLLGAEYSEVLVIAAPGLTPVQALAGVQIDLSNVLV